MIITVPQADFAAALHKAGKGVSGKNTIPVLSGIWMGAEDGELTLRSTDLDVAFEVKITCTVERPGAIVLPARHITELINRFEGGDVRLTVDERNYTARIEWGKGIFNMHGFQPDNFPVLPQVGDAEVFTIPQADLRRLIEQTEMAVSSDQTRPYLTGIHLVARERLHAIASDGVRVSASSVAVKVPKLSAIIPGLAMQRLVGFLGKEGDMQMAVLSSHAIIWRDDLWFATRLLEGQYPDLLRLVPQEFTTTIRLNAEAFLAALARVASLSADGVKFDFQPEVLTITGNRAEVGDAKEELSIELSGDPLEIGFNPRYLVDGLAPIKHGDFLFELRGSKEPARLRPVEGDDYLHIVLPLITY